MLRTDSTAAAADCIPAGSSSAAGYIPGCCSPADSTAAADRAAGNPADSIAVVDILAADRAVAAATAVDLSWNELFLFLLFLFFFQKKHKL